jgi:hypothetical protein
MSITLELPSQEEAWLRKRAARQGKELDNFVYDLVQREALQEKELAIDEGQSPADGLEGLIGVLDSGKPGLAEHAEEEWGKGLVEQYRAQGLTLKESS